MVSPAEVGRPSGTLDCFPCITLQGGAGWQSACQTPSACSPGPRPTSLSAGLQGTLDLVPTPVLVAPGHGVYVGGHPPFHALAGLSLPSISIH